MEVISVINVFNLSWVHLVLESSEIFFIEFSVVLSLEGVSRWMLVALLVLMINSLAGSLREALSIEVLTRYLRYVTGITWHVLSLYVAVGSSYPVFTLVGVVAKLESLCLEILQWWVNLIIVLFKIWF